MPAGWCQGQGTWRGDPGVEVAVIVVLVLVFDAIVLVTGAIFLRRRSERRRARTEGPARQSTCVGAFRCGTARGSECPSGLPSPRASRRAAAMSSPGRGWPGLHRVTHRMDRGLSRSPSRGLTRAIRLQRLRGADRQRTRPTPEHGRERSTASTPHRGNANAASRRRGHGAWDPLAQAGAANSRPQSMRRSIKYAESTRRHL